MTFLEKCVITISTKNNWEVIVKTKKRKNGKSRSNYPIKKRTKNMKIKAKDVLLAQKKQKQALKKANMLKAKANKMYDLWVLGGMK